jgi:hypothetical protein
MSDEHLPEPGGWNRLAVEADDLEAKVAELKQAGLSPETRSRPVREESRFSSKTAAATRWSCFSPA